MEFHFFWTLCPTGFEKIICRPGLENRKIHLSLALFQEFYKLRKLIHLKFAPKKMSFHLFLHELCMEKCFKNFLGTCTFQPIQKNIWMQYCQAMIQYTFSQSNQHRNATLLAMTSILAGAIQDNGSFFLDVFLYLN